MSKKSKRTKSTGKVNSNEEQLRTIADRVGHDFSDKSVSVVQAVEDMLTTLELCSDQSLTTAEAAATVVEGLREKCSAADLQIAGLKAQVDRLRLLLGQALDSRNRAEHQAIEIQIDAVTKLGVLAASQAA
jgi:hypothetical protein